MPLNFDPYSLGAPNDSGGILIEVASSTVVDNIFTFATVAVPSGKVRRVIEGKTYRTDWAGLFGFADKATLFQNIINHSAISNIVISSSFVVNSAITVPSDKRVIFERGGMITGTGVVTFEGNEIEAGAYQIFDIATPIKIVGGKTRKLLPEWFGASVVDTFDSGPALQKMVDAVHFSNVTANRTAFEVDVTRGVYRTSSPIYIRNQGITFKGAGMTNGSTLNLSGFGITTASINETVTQGPLATNETYSLNSYYLYRPRVGEVRVTLSGVSNGTRVYVYIAEGPSVQYFSMPYSGANTLLMENYRPTGTEKWVFAISDIGYRTAATLAAATTNNTVSVMNNLGSGTTIQSLTFSGKEVVSSAIANGASIQSPVPADGVVPPYDVKVTMTGVSIGTSLTFQVLRSNGTQPISTTFTYTGPDAVAYSGWIPGFVPHDTAAAYNGEFIVIGTTAAAATFANSRPRRYGQATGIINNVASSTITSWKLNDVEQFTQPKWAGKSLFDLSGFDQGSFRDLNIIGRCHENAMMIPYAAFHAWVDSTNPDYPTWFTQREHLYQNITITGADALSGLSWNKTRAFMNGFVVDGPATNNDFFEFQRVRFYRCEYGYFNMCNQAVEHKITDCKWGICDWAINFDQGSLNVQHPFLEYGVGAGFIQVKGGSSTSSTIVVNDFNTEGIPGFFFIRFRASTNTSLKVTNSQPVFWITTPNQYKMFSFLVATFVRGILEFDGGNYIMSNFGNASGSSFLGAKIRLPDTSSRSLSKVAITNAYTTIDALPSLFIEQFTSGICELELSTNLSLIGTGGNSGEFKGVYSSGNLITHTGSSSWSNELVPVTAFTNNALVKTLGTNTAFLDIGDQAKGGTLGINTNAYRFTPTATVVNGAYTTSSTPLPANRIILGVSVRSSTTLGVGVTSGTSSMDGSSFVRLYVGDSYKYDRWGWLNGNTLNANNSLTTSEPITYTTAQNLVFTPTHYYSSTSLSGTTLTVSGGGLDTAQSATFAGRKITIRGGAYEGTELTIVSINTSTTITIAETISISGSFPIDIMSNLKGNANTSLSYYAVEIFSAVGGRSNYFSNTAQGYRATQILT